LVPVAGGEIDHRDVPTSYPARTAAARVA
jgi:hypothetical protein